jgi:hypothetical protein
MLKQKRLDCHPIIFTIRHLLHRDYCPGIGKSLASGPFFRPRCGPAPELKKPRRLGGQQLLNLVRVINTKFIIDSDNFSQLINPGNDNFIIRITFIQVTIKCEGGVLDVCLDQKFSQTI